MTLCEYPGCGRPSRYILHGHYWCTKQGEWWGGHVHEPIEPAKEPTFGEHLRAAREATGLSLQAAADIAGISKQCWLELEHNKKLPRLTTLYGCAHAVGKTPCELLPEKIVAK